jgi:hypothetical protein
MITGVLQEDEEMINCKRCGREDLLERSRAVPGKAALISPKAMAERSALNEYGAPPLNC